MNILLVSNSFIIREALGNLFKDVFNSVHMNLVPSLTELEITDFLGVDFTFVDMKEESANHLEIISESKKICESLKVMILDESRNKDIFRKVINLDIEGYILSISEKEEFIYELKKVVKGKKIYDADLLQEVINDSKQNNIDALTIREREVLDKVAQGLNNKDIAKKLYITEYTVKKHVSSIFHKLNLKNRKELIVYVNKNKIKIA